MRIRIHNLKMNPAKCVFFAEAGDFLGFLVHQPGIEIPKDKAHAIINASPPTTKKELQQLIGWINFLRHFISNAAGKVQPFSPLLKLQGQPSSFGSHNIKRLLIVSRTTSRTRLSWFHLVPAFRLNSTSPLLTCPLADS